MPKTLQRLPIPDLLAEAALSMAPPYLRRRLLRTTTPFVDDDTSTFSYVGDARSVRIVHFMARFPDIPPMRRLAGTDLWYVTVRLPKRSRLEYQFVVERDERTTQVLDPLNRRTASDPFGANSVAHGPGYIDPPWTSPGVDGATGTIETIEIESSVFGGPRTLLVYLPAGFPGPDPYPVAVLHDGSDLVDYASVGTVFDNLAGSGTIPPLVGLLLDPVNRNREYMAMPEHGRFILEDVLPHAIAEFGISTDSADRIIGGASLGAVASLATAWRHPGTFDSLILLSGTFIDAVGGPRNRSHELLPVADFVRSFREEPGHPARRSWVACGKYEGLVDDNRNFLPALKTDGMEVTYSEPKDGHHWQSWRNSLGEALQTLLDPQ